MSQSSATARKALSQVPIKSAASKDLIERFHKLYAEIANRAFGIFESDGRIGRDLDNWIKAESQVLHPARVTLTETDGRLDIDAEVPGFEPKDLEVTLEPQRLIISGKRETKEDKKKGKAIYSEQSSNEIFRAVPLPVEVDPSKAAASLNNGILTVEVPKNNKAKH